MTTDAMDKGYQIFISSTFFDLQDERQAVLRAVRELEHMPAAIELFPATDDSAWQLIRDVTDTSDYYVLIVEVGTSRPMKLSLGTQKRTTTTPWPRESRSFLFCTRTLTVWLERKPKPNLVRGNGLRGLRNSAKGSWPHQGK